MSASITDQFPEWQEKVKLLTNSAWKDAQINDVNIDHWLANFCGGFTDQDVERAHAFHLLTQFIYLGKKEVDECLRVLFQEKLVYPFVQNRKRTTTDLSTIESALSEELIERTRFVGVGNPAESGTSFLYKFRKANDLPVEIFSSTYDGISLAPTITAPSNASAVLKNCPPDLKHLIYLDDFCGTGEQVQKRVRPFVDSLRLVNATIRISYFLLFATRDGLDALSRSNLFDDVEAVVVFDNDYKTFSSNSHYYKNPSSAIDKTIAEGVMRHYGEQLGYYGVNSLGFSDCQLLIGFEHNTPDNSLPVFWDTNPSLPWHPIFPRSKKY